MTRDQLLLFARYFPSFTGWPPDDLGLNPFDPEKLQEWANLYASDGQRYAAEFLLNLWSPSYPFNLHQALDRWDDAHYEAFLRVLNELRQPRPMYRYRVTRPNAYGEGTLGRMDPAGRQGYYVDAADETHAKMLILARLGLPDDEPLDVQPWPE